MGEALGPAKAGPLPPQYRGMSGQRGKKEGWLGRENTFIEEGGGERIGGLWMGNQERE